MYYMLLGAAAFSMVCGPVILRWFRTRRLKRQLSLFQYVCVKPISTTAASTFSAAAAASQPKLNAAPPNENALGKTSLNFTLLPKRYQSTLFRRMDKIIDQKQQQQPTAAALPPQ